jgi:hypothetical protein
MGSLQPTMDLFEPHTINTWMLMLMEESAADVAAAASEGPIGSTSPSLQSSDGTPVVTPSFAPCRPDLSSVVDIRRVHVL